MASDALMNWQSRFRARNPGRGRSSPTSMPPPGQGFNPSTPPPPLPTQATTETPAPFAQPSPGYVGNPVPSRNTGFASAQGEPPVYFNPSVPPAGLPSIRVTGPLPPQPLYPGGPLPPPVPFVPMEPPTMRNQPTALPGNGIWGSPNRGLSGHPIQPPDSAPNTTPPIGFTPRPRLEPGPREGASAPIGIVASSSESILENQRIVLPPNWSEVERWVARTPAFARHYQNFLSAAQQNNATTANQIAAFLAQQWVASLAPSPPPHPTLNPMNDPNRNMPGYNWNGTQWVAATAVPSSGGYGDVPTPGFSPGDQRQASIQARMDVDFMNRTWAHLPPEWREQAQQEWLQTLPLARRNALMTAYR